MTPRRFPSMDAKTIELDEAILDVAQQYEHLGKRLRMATLALEVDQPYSKVHYRVRLMGETGRWPWIGRGWNMIYARKPKVAKDASKPVPTEAETAVLAAKREAHDRQSAEEKARAEELKRIHYAEKGCLRFARSPVPVDSIAQMLADDRKRRGRWRRLAGRDHAAFASTFDHHNARLYPPRAPGTDRRDVPMARMAIATFTQYQTQKASH